MTGGDTEEPVEPGLPEHDPARGPAVGSVLPAELRDALAGVPFVAAALTALDLAVDELLDVRYPALSADEVRATVRGLQRALARVDAARLRAVKGVEDRDDIVPGARPGNAGSSFLRYGLGLDSGEAHRDAAAARLLDPDTGDLQCLGAAYAAGEIHRGHVDVGVRVHRRLGPTVRSRVDPATGEVCIGAVDEVLAAQSRRVSVSELDRFGRELVDRLNPATPDGAHERRYLHLGVLPDGSLVGKFACGPVQGLALQAAISAGAVPRPGKAIDADGVVHDLPDTRSPAQRRMDALADVVASGLERAGIRLPTGESPTGENPTSESRAGESPTGESRAGESPAGSPETGARTRGEKETPPSADAPPAASADAPPASEGEAPASEGEEQVLREPGVLSGPYPNAEILITATLDQLVAALAACGVRATDLQLPLGEGDTGPPGSGDATADRFRAFGAGPGLASAQQGGPVHPGTLARLACSAALRRVLLGSSGAVLELGRATRLATAAQRRALVARDGGCVIPGCVVPADHCEAHHVIPWAAGGATDLANLCLLCSRHHTEADNGSWGVSMIEGVPWVRPPAWIHRERPLVRGGRHGLGG